MVFRRHKSAFAIFAIITLLGVAVCWSIQRLAMVYSGSIVIGSRNPTYEGRTMARWLKTLASEAGGSESALNIIRVHVDTNLHGTIEVPLSYDLMRKHDFLRGTGEIFVVIDGAGETIPPSRGTNGNILFALPWHLRPGLHNVQVEFNISGHSYDRLHARGAVKTIAFPYSAQN